MLRLMVVGLRLQLKPLDEVTEKLTVPWNPVDGFTVTAEVAGEPTGAERTLGLAEIEKSGVAVVTNVVRT
jgi:hypothetical protein